MPRKRTLREIEKAIEKAGLKYSEKAIPAGYHIMIKGCEEVTTKRTIVMKSLLGGGGKVTEDRSHYYTKERKISLCPKCFKKYLRHKPPFDADDTEGVVWKLKKLKGEVECTVCKKKMQSPFRMIRRD
jgi:hypothetical protein